MKKNLQEQINRINQIITLTNHVLIEASKKDILINKLNLVADHAEWIESHCGRLSIWMTNKIFEHIRYVLVPTINDAFLHSALNSLNLNYDDLKLNDMGKLLSRWSLYFTQDIKPKVISIMDYITVYLNGNISSLKEDTFITIYDKSKEWHDSLKGSSGDINYIENNEIIIDFRDENGIGFYWCNLNTNISDEECERMGHCGRTARGNNLFSLRQFRQINKNYTINTSHLTASISMYGNLMQLKGKSNSKPKEEYHKYILPLLNYKTTEDEYLITSFECEYDCKNDFEIVDLKDKEILKLYENRPELFNSYKTKKILYDLGVIEKPNLKFTLHIKPEEITGYVNLNREINEDFIISILSFEYSHFWDRNYSDDWNQYFHLFNNESINEMFKYLNSINSDPEFIKESEFLDISNEDELTEFIKKWDDDENIKWAIVNTLEDVEREIFYDYIRKSIKSLIEDTYGTVREMNDTGIIVDVDLETLIPNLSVLDEHFDACGDDNLECVLIELISSHDFNIPNFDYDDRYYPHVDSDYADWFNESFVGALEARIY